MLVQVVAENRTLRRGGKSTLYYNIWDLFNILISQISERSARLCYICICICPSIDWPLNRHTKSENISSRSVCAVYVSVAVFPSRGEWQQQVKVYNPYMQINTLSTHTHTHTHSSCIEPRTKTSYVLSEPERRDATHLHIYYIVSHL